MDYKKLLKEHGLKSTKARKAVLEVLEKVIKPISAGDLHKRVSKQADLVTVYRILHTLREKGIVFTETILDETCYYMADKPHHHIMCDTCEAVECVPCDHSFVVTNFTNIQHFVSLTGTCQKCI